MKHVSTLKLHQYRYGELDAAGLSEVRAHLEACERCRARLRAQEAERAAFVTRPVPGPIQELAPKRRRSWWWIPALALPLAAIALVVARIEPRTERVGPLEILEQVRAKGERPTLEIWRKTPDGTRALASGERLRAGDVVQPMLDPRGAAWVALAGRDGEGALEIWGGYAVEQQGLQPTPFALTLDDTPGPQTFVLVAADRALGEAELRAALEPGSNVPGVRTYTVRVDKEG